MMLSSIQFSWIFKQIIKVEPEPAKVTAPAPAKYPGSGRLRLRYPGPTVQQVQNSQFYLSALLLFAGSGSGTIIPGPDAVESSGVLVFVFLIMYYFVVMIRCTYINYILSYFFFSSRRRRWRWRRGSKLSASPSTWQSQQGENLFHHVMLSKITRGTDPI